MKLAMFEPVHVKVFGESRSQDSSINKSETKSTGQGQGILAAGTSGRNLCGALPRRNYLTLDR